MSVGADGKHARKDGVSVFGLVGFDESTGVAAKQLFEFGSDLRDQVKRLHLFGMGQVAHFGEGFGADHGSDGDGFVGVKDLARFVGGQEFVHRRGGPRSTGRIRGRTTSTTRWSRHGSC